MSHLFNTDFHYAIDLDYDNYCHGCHGCDTGDDYCRGSVYENFSLERPVDIWNIVDHATRGHIDTRHAYGIVKAIEADTDLVSSLSSIDAWDIETSGGYYGDEIDHVKIDSPHLEKLEAHAASVLALDPDEAVRKALVAEYEKLLPRLDRFEAYSLPISMLDPSNAKVHAPRVAEHKNHVNVFALHSHRKKPVAGKIDGANNYGLPLAIVRPAKGPAGSEKYRIVDGNHRYEAWKRDKNNADTHVRVLVALPVYVDPTLGRTFI